MKFFQKLFPPSIRKGANYSYYSMHITGKLLHQVTSSPPQKAQTPPQAKQAPPLPPRNPLKCHQASPPPQTSQAHSHPHHKASKHTEAESNTSRSRPAPGTHNMVPRTPPMEAPPDPPPNPTHPMELKKFYSYVHIRHHPPHSSHKACLHFIRFNALRNLVSDPVLWEAH